MNNSMVKAFYLFLMLCNFLYCQIDSDAPDDWSRAGYRGDIPRVFDVFINMKEIYNLKGDGITDDAPQIQTAINDKISTYPDNFVVLYFPAGNYILSSSINIPADASKLVIMGQGSDQTQFTATHSDVVFNIASSSQPGLVAVPSNYYSQYNRGSTSIQVPFSSIQQNDFIEIQASDGYWYGHYSSSNQNPVTDSDVGQIIKVTGVALSGGTSTLTLEDYLRLDYGLNTGYDNQTYDLHPLVQKIVTVNNIGFENFTLNNASSGGESCFNFNFDYSTDCWMWGVKSQRPYKAHVSIKRSSGIEIRGCYFYDAQAFGGGGQGYGITINTHSTDCLVENNVFDRLRHAMMVQTGANGNVFGYNFSNDQYSPGESDNGDISIHGHFPYDNLFEGNMALFADGDAYWGSNGPRNTLFRNELRRTPSNICNSADYVYHNGGIRITGPYVNGLEIPQYFYILGCTVQRAQCLTTLGVQLAEYANATEAAVNEYVGAIGHVGEYAGYPVDRGFSLYYSSKPEFLTSSYSWPPMGCKYGNNIPTQSIPAKDRFYYQSTKTEMSPPFTTQGTVTYVNQKLNNGSSIGVISKWNGTAFGAPFTPPKSFLFDIGSTQVLKGDQSIYSNQKYNNWSGEADIINHHPFTINTGVNNLTSNFKPTNSGITIQNYFVDGNIQTGGNVQFKDPWLIDYADPGYGNTIRNRGMNAPFKIRTSPFVLDYTTSYSGDIYKGVFMNQPYTGNNPVYYSVQAQPQDINLGGSLGTHKFYLQNWSGTDVTFQDPNSSQTAVVFNSSSAVVKANLKGTQLSNQTDALAGNGQRKIVKTSDGYLHQVYESLNKVWYERSTDNGQTWQIMNGGRAVSVDGYKAKGASIDYFTNSYHNLVVIVYQQQTVWGSAINADIFENGANQRNEVLVNYNHSAGNFDYYDAKPVVAINSNAQALIAWYVNGEIINSFSESGLNYKYGYIYLYSGVSWYFSWYTSAPVVMSNANYITISNPTLDTYKSSIQPFQLAYKRSNTIYYNTLTDNYNYTNHIQEGSVQNISSGGGYTFNNNPSLIAVNGGARVVWEGKNSSANRNVVFHDPGYYYFWSFNSTGGYYDCLSPNINRPDNYSAYFFGWSENNNGYVLNNSLSYINIKYLGINGQYMQLNNGATPGAMYATTLNTSGSPYYFTKSSGSIGSLYGLSKDANSFAGIEGRKGVVFKDSAQFYFDINKIKVDGQDIKFVEIYKEENITNIESLNKYLISEPFTLSSKSEFTYNVNYGVTDTASGNAVLGENDFISFKLQLIEDKTGKVIGEFDDVKYTKNNLFEYKNVDYQVDANGVGNKSVRLKLIVNNNFESGYALSMSNTGDGTDGLSKESYKQISYNQNNVVTSYDLAQNYPNPFNPTTIIKYQLPKEGYVTLKIYDILGREIVTLVDEFKTQGSYNVTFNANNLASGIYIYQLRANDFVSNKKLILMK